MENIKTDGMTCEVLNTEGQTIMTIKLKEPKTKIDMRELNSGLYLVKVVSDDGIAIKKMIKQ